MGEYGEKGGILREVGNGVSMFTRCKGDRGNACQVRGPRRRGIPDRTVSEGLPTTQDKKTKLMSEGTSRTRRSKDLVLGSRRFRSFTGSNTQAIKV